MAQPTANVSTKHRGGRAWGDVKEFENGCPMFSDNFDYLQRFASMVIAASTEWEAMVANLGHLPALDKIQVSG